MNPDEYELWPTQIEHSKLWPDCRLYYRPDVDPPLCIWWMHWTDGYSGSKSDRLRRGGDMSSPPVRCDEYGMQQRQE